MGTKSDKRKLKWFIGGLAILALVLNSLVNAFWHRNDQTNQTGSQSFSHSTASQAVNEQAVREAAVRKAAEAHATELARYLNSGVVRKSGTKTMSIVMVTEDGMPNRAVTDLFSSKFKDAPAEILPSFFTQEFVADGLFKEAMRDAMPISKRLELTKNLDLLFLGQQVVSYTTNANLEGVISAHMELQITAANLAKSKQSPMMAYRVDGAGFSTSDARAAAEARILKLIEEDPQPEF